MHMKSRKTILPLLALSLALVFVLVIASRPGNIEPGPSTMSAVTAWEASPDGIRYKEWERSPAGRKIHASRDNIKKQLQDFSEMEAEVIAVDYQRPNAGGIGPKWLIVRIQGEDYMMQYSSADFQKLSSLKVNDRIIVRSRSAGFSPNHAYLILSGDHITKDNKVLFERVFNKDEGC